jgi:hypothetical protein
MPSKVWIKTKTVIYHTRKYLLCFKPFLDRY